MLCSRRRSRFQSRTLRCMRSIWCATITTSIGQTLGRTASIPSGSSHAVSTYVRETALATHLPGILVSDTCVAGPAARTAADTNSSMLLRTLGTLLHSILHRPELTWEISCCYAATTETTELRFTAVVQLSHSQSIIMPGYTCPPWRTGRGPAYRPSTLEGQKIRLHRGASTAHRPKPCFFSERARSTHVALYEIR